MTDTTQQRPAPHNGPADQPVSLDGWARRRLGKGISAVSVTELQTELSPISGLSYNERSSGAPLGGRVAFHLQHVEEADAIRLLRRADDFLSPSETRGSRRPLSRLGRRQSRWPGRRHPRRAS